jgi:hypothetical protein
MKSLRRAAILLCLVWPSIVTAEDPPKATYSPGLGEFMTFTQLRHAKLWFAGQAKNWDLAGYEIDELKEGLEDAAKFHPSNDGIPVGEMIKANVTSPLDQLAKAVAEKSATKFNQAFDELTAACNTCHVGANKAFIKIRRPTQPPVSNQDFGSK